MVKLLNSTQILNVNLVTFRAASFPVTSFCFVGPTRTFRTDWVLLFKFFHHFLLLTVCGRFEVRTVLYMLRDTFLTILSFIFMSSFIADRTQFVSSLVDDCSILGFLTSSRVILVTRGALIWLVTFGGQSSIGRLVSE